MAVTPEFAIALIRVGWLTLVGMMLFSRIAFQAAGPVRMRAFLNAWKDSRTKRVWGAIALFYGVVVLVVGGSTLSRLDAVDMLLFVLLLGVLIGDGLLNVLPGSFGKFKERMQDEWVRRQGGRPQSGDRELFGSVNLFLAIASLAMAAVVVLYKAIGAEIILASFAISIVLTVVLVAGAVRERDSASTTSRDRTVGL